MSATAARRPTATTTDQRERFERACADLDAPFALVDLDAFWANARDMVRRAGGKPIRLASKSVRCRALQERVLADESGGFRGILGFTLPEALWLSDQGFDDIVVAYPTADRAALRDLAERGRGPAIMVDSAEQLDYLESAVGGDWQPLRVCIDVDASWSGFGGRVKMGAKRSPVHTAEQAAALAREIVARPGFELVGIMAYEAQIAGVGDRPPGSRLMGMAIRRMQRASRKELAVRRAEIVA